MHIFSANKYSPNNRPNISSPSQVLIFIIGAPLIYCGIRSYRLLKRPAKDVTRPAKDVKKFKDALGVSRQVIKTSTFTLSPRAQIAVPESPLIPAKSQGGTT